MADGGQHAVPNTGTQRRIEQERTHLHTGQTGRDGDELTDGGNKTAHKGRYGAVLLKVGLGLGHPVGVDEQGVGQARVGKLVDQRAAQPAGQVVVDQRADVGTQRGKEHDEVDVQLTTRRGQPRGRRHDDFRREWDKRALDGHQQSDGPIIQVVQTPLNKGY